MKADFPPKLSGETKSFVFDFTSSLAIGETVSSASVVATVWSGNDPTPSGIVSGAASVSSPQVTQTITAGVVGTIYQLICSAVTSAGQTLLGYGLMTVLGSYK